MKLLLFDIDGTLLLGRGVPRKVFLEVIQQRFPDFPSDHKVRFSGMTDPQIVHDLLSFNGYSSLLTEKLVEEIISEFILALPRQMNRSNPPQILPGVRELLDFCENRPDYHLGLVTGNVMQGARIKLDAVDLYRYFAVGAFGCDDRNRDHLPPIAIYRASRYFNRSFSNNQVWIIGDSVRDVQCARVNRLNCLAVATGFTSTEELTEVKPDYLLPDLTDIDRILGILDLPAS